jgi:hypothetical protein
MAKRKSKPFVLHVDDDAGEMRDWIAEVQKQSRVEIEVCTPDEVSEDSLRRASVVLVDFKLERWPQRENAGSLALKPLNGLALLAVLQEAAYELDKESPRAFALFTAVVNDVARGLIPQPHVVARAHNLEWIFDKKATSNDARASLVAELTEAVCALPRPWPGDSSEQSMAELKKWLAIPTKVPWIDAAWDDVVRCRPPIHEFAEHTHGIGVLRWALHRIWPYPTFLFDDARLAARLRVELASLRAQLKSNTSLQKMFSVARYDGSLNTFGGRRWWRAGVESVVFRLASEDPANTGMLHAALKKIAPELKVYDTGMVFPVIDEKFVVRDSLATVDQVVEVVPDDWPPFADAAWALASDLAEHPELAAIAVRPQNAEG